MALLEKATTTTSNYWDLQDFEGSSYHDDHLAHPICEMLDLIWVCLEIGCLQKAMVYCHGPHDSVATFLSSLSQPFGRRDCGLKFSLWNDLGSSFGLCSHERPGGSDIFVPLVGWFFLQGESFCFTQFYCWWQHILTYTKRSTKEASPCFPIDILGWLQHHTSLWEPDVRGTSQLHCLTRSRL